MNTFSRHPAIEPVLPSLDIARDLVWYKKHTGFEPVSYNEMYAVLSRDSITIHLQWHADTEADPLLGGSVIKIFVDDIIPYYDEFLERKTISEDKLHRNTTWSTHELGFYDLNKNAIFFVEDIN